MTNPNDAKDFYDAIRPLILRDIREQTKSCIRSRRAVVTTAPDSETGKIGVKFPFDDTEIFLPYSAACADFAVGQQATVLIPYAEGGNLSNGVVFSDAKFSL